MKLFFNFFYLFIIGGLLISCSETEPSAIEPENDDLLVQNLYEHSKEFTQNVYSYKNGIHAAVGFGIANSFMVEGDNSNIIIDATDSVYQAEKVYAKFQAINSNPISAIIYTHNHADHTYGATVFAEESNPEIYAHSSTGEYLSRVIGILRPIISSRSNRMFGNALPKEEVENNGIGPFLEIGRDGRRPGLLYPTKTFDDKKTLRCFIERLAWSG